MKKIVGVLAVCAFLVGCGTQNEEEHVEKKSGGEPIDGIVTMYNCQGEQVQAIFNEDEMSPVVQLMFVDRDSADIILPRTKATSEMQYSNGNVIFWTHENEAMLSMEDTGQSLNCMRVDDVTTEEMDDMEEGAGDEKM